MPLFRRKESPGAPPNPEDWRPQRFGRARRSLRDSIIEPSWDGVRVLAHFDLGGTRLIDEGGVDCTAEFAGVADAITAAARATALILDGFLTVEPTQVVVGVLTQETEAPGAGRMMAQMLAGDLIVRPAKSDRRLDPDRPVAFVAVDLLQVDGAPLLNVPLLERKRLLDGSLQPAELVRITPFIRPPVGSFVNTWRDMGFSAIAYKASNSRYMPDVRNDDWSIFPMPPK